MTDGRLRGLVAATILVLAAMLLAGPHGCGTQFCLFDARVIPYGAEAARDHLARLTPAGLWRYLWVTQPLDTVFPALFCLSLRAVFEAWAPAPLAARLGRLAVIEAGVDYLENALIRVMLKDPAGFPDIVAPVTSALTIAKWLMIAVLLGAALRLWRARRV